MMVDDVDFSCLMFVFSKGRWLKGWGYPPPKKKIIMNMSVGHTHKKS